MKRLAISVVLLMNVSALFAQDEASFKATCINEEVAACSNAKWEYPANAMTLPNNWAAIVNGLCQNHAVPIGTLQGAPATVQGTIVLEVVARASQIEGVCADRARRLDLLQKQLAVQADLQAVLKGDMQSVLAKLVPGATVTITLPPAPAAAPAPKQ